MVILVTLLPCKVMAPCCHSWQPIVHLFSICKVSQQQCDHNCYYIVIRVKLKVLYLVLQHCTQCMHPHTTNGELYDWLPSEHIEYKI